MKKQEQLKITIKSINQLLSDLYLLWQNLRYAHWNISWENFITHHEYLWELYTINNTIIDDFAERIKALWWTPISSLSDVLKKTKLQELSQGNNYIDLFIHILWDLEHINSTLNEYIENVDKITEDMLIWYTNDIEKNIWFIRSILNK